VLEISMSALVRFSLAVGCCSSGDTDGPLLGVGRGEELRRAISQR
jgi:hypothetical protein